MVPVPYPQWDKIKGSPLCSHWWNLEFLILQHWYWLSPSLQKTRSQKTGDCPGQQSPFLRYIDLFVTVQYYNPQYTCHFMVHCSPRMAAASITGSHRMGGPWCVHAPEFSNDLYLSCLVYICASAQMSSSLLVIGVQTVVHIQKIKLSLIFRNNILQYSRDPADPWGIDTWDLHGTRALTTCKWWASVCQRCSVYFVAVSAGLSPSRALFGSDGGHVLTTQA
jgi:hypothetical protein